MQSRVVTYNVELFRRINEVISARPEEHDQTTWEMRSPECGTVRCVAGWAIFLTTGANLYARPAPLDLDDGETTLSPQVRELAGELGVPPSVPAVARELLGLTRDEAASLFYSAEDDEARTLVYHIAAGRTDEARRWFARRRAE